MADLIDGLGGTTGFGEGVLDPNDDGSTGFIDITSVFESGIKFFGTVYTGFWVNNNGSITFTTPTSDFTPEPLGFEPAGLYPLWNDVDTDSGPVAPTPGGNSQGTNLVYFDLDPVADTVTITWDDVGAFDNDTSALNAYQIVLTDVSGNPGRAAGDFDFEFRYEDVNDAFVFTDARAGYTAGDGVNFFELPSSGVEAEMLDLDIDAGNTGVAGLWRFSVVHGDVGDSICFIEGDANANDIEGKGGPDYIAGLAGNDTLRGRQGDDTIAGGEGDDRIFGGTGIDTADFSGASAGVQVDLNAGTATGEGQDSLFSIENVTGSAFADVITGDAGDNVLNGGEGLDLLQGSSNPFGATGKDTFVFDNLLNGDTVIGFQANEDVIDVSELVTGFDPLADDIADYVIFQTTFAGGVPAVAMFIDADGTGGGAAPTLAAQFSYNWFLDARTLYDNGQLLVKEGASIVAPAAASVSQVAGSPLLSSFAGGFSSDNPDKAELIGGAVVTQDMFDFLF